MRCCLSFLSTAAAIFLATTANADIINMRCKGPLHEYQLKYDDETYKLVQIFDRIETYFILEEMKKDKADFKFIAYPGALHAFTNPESDENAKKYKMPVAYDAKADQDSWSQLKTFLKGLFS